METQAPEGFEVKQLESTVNVETLSTVIKAEIDMQISTAKAYPRSLQVAMQRALSLATLSQDVAESCIYALPRGGKRVEGPSVRLAEIIGSSWGNMRSGARVISNDGKTITSQGICHDLETNFAVTMEVKRRITDKYGKTFNEDMQVMTGNACNAIAFRNAIFKVIPRAMIDQIMLEVKKVSRGDVSTLPERRTKAVDWFNKKGVTNEMICEHFDIKKIEDVDLDMLQTLSGYKNAVTQEEVNVISIFKPEIEKPEPKKEALTDIEGTVRSIELGMITLEQIEQNYELTDEQREALKTVKAKKK